MEFLKNGGQDGNASRLSAPVMAGNWLKSSKIGERVNMRRSSEPEVRF